MGKPGDGAKNVRRLPFSWKMLLKAIKNLKENELAELNKDTIAYFDDSIDRLESIESILNERLSSIEDILLQILDEIVERKGRNNVRHIRDKR